ncbi:hypothetical protein DITRI_Ditri02bG0107600 [Diplodiscus trichospermus]
MKAKKSLDFFNWIPVCDNLVSLPHLYFANDTLILCGSDTKRQNSVKMLSVIWKGSVNGRYSVRQFCLDYNSANTNSQSACTGLPIRALIGVFVVMQRASSWHGRNEVIFKAKVVATVLRVALWWKAKWPCIQDYVSTIMRYPSLIKVSSLRHQSCVMASWQSPLIGSLKFNVDGSALGHPSRARIWGILCDNSSKVKAIGVADSNIVELLAIREAFIIFITS